MKASNGLLASAIFLLTAGWHVTALQQGEQTGAAISRAVYDDLVLYTRYSAAAYGSVCPKPMGNTLIERIRDSNTGTDGMIVRDHRRKEIIVVFRGTSEFEDVLTDIKFRLVPLQSPGLNHIGNVNVHNGFLAAYNAVANDVLRIVKSQMTVNPSYGIVVTGHSLGGAIASLAAIAIRAQHLQVPMRLFTFGQPRVGDAQFAAYVEHAIGINNIYRVVHTIDGVPAAPPWLWGYRHFATEYWNFIDPPSPLTTRRCNGGEDPSCFTTVPFTGINLAHTIYFGQVMLPMPSLCS